MNYLAFSGILIFISSIFAAGIVIFKASKNIISLTWILFSLSVALWGIGLFKAFHTEVLSLTLLWGRFLNIVAIFIPILFLHFVFSFTNKIQANRGKLSLFYLITIIYFLSVLLFPNWFVNNVEQKLTFKYYPSPGPLYYLLPVLFFYFVTYGVIILFKEFLNSPEIKRNQIKYLLFGVLTGFIGGSTTFFLVFDIKIPPIGTLLVPIYVCTVSYAIVRHNLLDINIVFRKTLIYSLIIAFLFVISVIILFILGQFLGYLFPLKTFWLTLFLVATLAILFQPLYHWSTSLIDKLFFKGTLPKVAEELQKAEKLAALGVLASGLAHEIKNPLAPIKTYIQNLSDNANDPQYIAKLTKVIPSEIDKITNIINQLRDFANPSPLSISRINLHNLIDKKLNLLEQDFISRKIEVIKEYSSGLPEINADSIQLEKVFLNLFLNAVDAMPNGGKLTISTEINSNNTILIKASDTGIGIDKKDMSHIFDPFYSKGKQKGMGLGLAVVYQIIKEHGGSVQVASIQWRGTTFTISIPINKNI